MATSGHIYLATDTDLGNQHGVQVLPPVHSSADL